ncbi:MAG: hypothetical protein KKH94_04310 [Candidatus Omnitrophica bacterium]|nr:hypothetical protein [Candidatus Omnitrophota bacterium]
MRVERESSNVSKVAEETALSPNNMSKAREIIQIIKDLLRSKLHRGYYGKIEIGCYIHDGSIQSIEKKEVEKIIH